MDKNQIWLQQDGEPPEWFERFLIFKLLGGSRSLTAAYNDEGKRKGRDKSKSSPPGWRAAAKTWNWATRAQSWDKHQQGKTEERWEKTQSEWEKRRFELRNEEWKLSRALVARAQEMLEYPLTFQILKPDGVEESELKNLDRIIGGASREVTEAVLRGGVAIVVPVRWSMRDASLYLETANKLAVAATGSQQQQTGEMEALNTLIEAGWIPESVLDVAQTKMDELRDAVRAAFEGLGVSDGV